MNEDDSRDPGIGQGRIPPGLENIDTCARCDAPIDRRGWHYTGLENDGDEIRIHVFCSERCRDQWLESGD